MVKYIQVCEMKFLLKLQFNLHVVSLTDHDKSVETVECYSY